LSQLKAGFEPASYPLRAKVEVLVGSSAIRLGLISSVACLVAILGYGVAQIAQVIGLVAYPVADILIYATSLGIAVPYLLTLLALSECVDGSEPRLWMRGALLFGTIYVVFAGLMYTTQLSVVIPQSWRAPDAGVLGVRPQSLFWNIDALAYVSMGISTLFLALSFPHAAPWRWARRLLFANGAITPIVGFVYFYPHFSLAVLLLASPWLITTSGSMLALVLVFVRRDPMRIHAA
jgi:hypothetical protein